MSTEDIRRDVDAMTADASKPETVARGEAIRRALEGDDLPVVWLYRWEDGTFHTDMPCDTSTRWARLPCRPCPIGENGKTEEERRLKFLASAALKFKARIAELEAALVDFRDAGVRADTTPTMINSWSTQQWYAYLDRINQGVKERARKALAGGEGCDGA